MSRLPRALPIGPRVPFLVREGANRWRTVSQDCGAYAYIPNDTETLEQVQPKLEGRR